MKKKTFFLLIILGFIIVMLGFLLFVFNAEREVTEIPVRSSPEKVISPEVTGQSITAKHQFRDGTHVVAGEFNLPTPCHLLNTRALIRESTPRQVVIEFNVISQDEELCAQVITPTLFKISFDAAKEALITATVNGDGAILNLLQVDANEDLDDFEVYIKG